MATSSSKGQAPKPERAVIEWLLDSDPSDPLAHRSCAHDRQRIEGSESSGRSITTLRASALVL